MRKHKRVVREKQSRDVDSGIGELKASLVHVRAPPGICSWSPSLLWSRAWSHHYGSHQVDEDLAIKAMLTTSCTSYLDSIFTIWSFPWRRGLLIPRTRSSSLLHTKLRVENFAEELLRLQQAVTRRLQQWFTQEPNTKQQHLALSFSLGLI